MIENHQRLVNRYRRKGILLDTNLLLLLFVGLVNIGWIGQFKRISNQKFTAAEFSLLEDIVNQSSLLLTTPHILAETSNFIFQDHSENQPLALLAIAKNLQAFKERRPEAKKLVMTEAFAKFGLTDSGILDLPPGKYLVLSVDAELVVALQKKKVDAINFNHLRQQAWV